MRLVLLLVFGCLTAPLYASQESGEPAQQLVSKAPQLVSEEPQELNVENQALDPEKPSNQIVVITDPRFVPISQYFSSELNDLPPSSSGKSNEPTRRATNP